MKWCDVAGPNEAGLRMLATAITARRRGIGTALIREALARAEERGCERLVLGTLDFLTDAVRIYRRMGFQRIPERDKVLPSLPVGVAAGEV